MKTQDVKFEENDWITYCPKEDTVYDIDFDNWKIRKSLVVDLQTPGLSCSVFCYYKVIAGSTFDLDITIKHIAPRTSCDAVIRGVLYSGGVSNFASRTIINKCAAGTSSTLEDKVLVLGEGTCNHSKPFVQIETNDVIASHKAVTSKPDEAQIFYLESRGISYQEACETLIKAFLSSGAV